MKVYSKWFMRIAAIYALIGGLLGSDLAGRGDYAIVPVHAHILVVGWLSLFAYGLFYYVIEEVGMKRTVKAHFWSALIGGGFMPIGMLLYYKVGNTASLIAFITSASILLVAFGLFVAIVFLDKKIFTRS